MPGPSRQTGALHLRQLAQIGGASWAVARQGDLAYVGLGTRVLAVDVSDPTALRPIGQSPSLPGAVRDIDLAGHLAYVAADRAGLQIVDVSDPARMAVVGSYDTESQTMALALSGSHAFLAASKDGLLVLDVSDPAAPRLAGSMPPSERLLDIALADDVAYVVDRQHALDVVDVRDPAHPVRIGHLDSEGHVERVAAGDGTVFVTTDTGELRAVSVADAAHPAVVSSMPIAAECGYDTCSPPDVVVDAGRAYVSGNALAIFDVSDPVHMRAINPVALEQWDRTTPVLGDLSVAGGVALATLDDVGGLAGSEAGLAAFDITLPDQPREVGRLAAPGELWRPALAGLPDDTALIHGSARIDVATPAAPRYAGQLPLVAIPDDVAVAGDLAYAVGWDVILQIVDLADAARPLELGRLTAPAGTGGEPVDWSGSHVAVAGDRAFVAGAMWGWGQPVFAVVDVRDPTAPRLLGTLGAYDDALAADAERVAASPDGRYAYLAEGWSNGDMVMQDGPGHLQVVDALDPEHPRVVGTLSIEEEPPPDLAEDWAWQGGASDMAVGQGVAYIAAEKAGLWAVDLTEPTAPRKIGVLDYGTERVRRVALAWPTAFAAVGKRIVAVDVRHPEAMRQVAAIDVPAEVAALTTHRGIVWASAGEAGLIGLELGP
jgi:hypothetical protein